MMRGAIAWGLVFLCIAVPASAFKISPFKMSLRVGADGGTAMLKIENSAPEPVAVQVRAVTWRIDPSGAEENKDASSDFIIFPSQLVLGPRETKSVRLQYKGENPGASEKAYRIIAEQLPVNLKDVPEGKAGVRLLLTFKAALYVSGAEVKSDIVLRQISRQPDGRYRLNIENKGTGHGIIKSPELTLHLPGGAEKKIAPKDLRVLEGQNIQAGASRVIDLALPGIASDVIGAELRTSAEY